jgi:hypothetical protein
LAKVKKEKKEKSPRRRNAETDTGPETRASAARPATT